ncbi:hypothetical protein F897_02495 [Acinetobacter variabilis]|uniref:Uncharacterized protein n=1 Tax=Acinetobacter variabilis TaxID=70346 RepID=N9MHP8_9GAMM|nr:hypothetical protein F897_02495 [Acinetobacter variabilis]
MSNKLDLSFEVVRPDIHASREYTKTCSGGVSDCCTRTCTRITDDSNSSLDAWEQYLEVNEGILQY